MERKESLTTHLKTCNISYISPVKQFDLPQENDLRTKKASKCLAKSSNVQIAELQSTVNRQQTEMRKLKEVISVKDKDYEHLKIRLEKATQLIDDVANGKSNLNEVKDFLDDNSKKRKVDSEVAGQITKKRKEEEQEDQKLLSFNVQNPDLKDKRKKRKLEDQDRHDLDFLLKKPSKLESEKEMNLNKLDEQIKVDTEKYQKMEEEWKRRDEKQQELKELKAIERQKAAKLKEIIRNNLSDEALVKMTHDNMDYLSKIVSGEAMSPKHSLYFDKCGKKSQSLLYTSVNEPFTDGQVDTVYALVSENFKFVPQIEENYISWVLLSEALLKIFMDYFKIEDRSDAERLIEICPLDDELDNEYSSSPI